MRRDVPQQVEVEVFLVLGNIQENATEETTEGTNYINEHTAIILWVPH